MELLEDWADSTSVDSAFSSMSIIPLSVFFSAMISVAENNVLSWMLASGNAFPSDQHKCEEDSMETQFFFGEMSGSDAHNGDLVVINRAKLQ